MLTIDKEEKKVREMTNIEYARTLDRGDLFLINRVATDYIKRIVGENAPIWIKEKAFDQWCNEPYNAKIWDKIRAERAGKLIFGM